MAKLVISKQVEDNSLEECSLKKVYIQYKWIPYTRERYRLRRKGISTEMKRTEK